MAPDDLPGARVRAAGRPSFIVLAAALAGCIAPAAPFAGAPLPGAFAWGDLLVGRGGDAETSLVVGPDGGTVLACSHGGFRAPSPLWASDDGGATFRPLDPQPNPAPSGDCDVVVAESGEWAIVYDTLASATVAVSSDRGATWRIHPLAAVPFGGVDRPWLASAGGLLLLSYASIMSAEPAIAALTTSADGGRTWSAPTAIATAADLEGESNCFVGKLVSSPDAQRLAVPLDCYSLTATLVRSQYLARSADGGATWDVASISEPAPHGHFRMPVLSEAGGRAWLAFTSGEARDVHVITSTDGGATWTEPMLVVRDSGMDLGWPWIDARPDGSATLAWMNETRPEGAPPGETIWQVHVARVRADPEPRVEFARPAGPAAVGLAPAYEFLMVRHGSDGRALVLYPVPGEDCATSPGLRPGIDRGTQCVHLLRESGGPAASGGGA